MSVQLLESDEDAKRDNTEDAIMQHKKWQRGLVAPYSTFLSTS